MLAVSPASLSTYATASGWVKGDAYGDHSDVYFADGLPEIILPRTRDLSDYSDVVLRLIKIFAAIASTDELSLYRNLIESDRDVIRIRAIGTTSDGTTTIKDGVALINGARDMMLAAACSLEKPQPFYPRASNNMQAKNYLRWMQLGLTEHGGLVVSLLSPSIPLAMQQEAHLERKSVKNLGAKRQEALRQIQMILQETKSTEEISTVRQTTRHLVSALKIAQEATQKMAEGNGQAFFETVSHGVSANLCTALAMLVKPFQALEIDSSWAHTKHSDLTEKKIRFSKGDAPLLLKASRLLRYGPFEQNVRLTGFVQRLKQAVQEEGGTATLQVRHNEVTRLVTAALNKFDYKKAIAAHEEKAQIAVIGDLGHVGRQWRLKNSRIEKIIKNKDSFEKKR